MNNSPHYPTELIIEEKTVLALMLEGLPIPEIAKKCEFSTLRTIAIRSDILKKFGVANEEELIKSVQETGVFPPIKNSLVDDMSQTTPTRPNETKKEPDKINQSQKSNSYQIQCPNCGAYEIKPTNTSSVLESILTIFGLFIYLVPGLLMMRSQSRRDTEKFNAGENTAICQLCKYEFWFSEVPSEPIRPNQQLIQAGRRRLEEEEEERRRRRRNFED